MDRIEEICCLCLSALNVSFTDLFMKNQDGLTHFEKISSSLFHLANFLNENSHYIYKVCQKCCDTIETIYQFNKTCLHNIEIYLSNIVKAETVMEQMKSIDDQHCVREREKLFVKTEPCLDSQQSDNPIENLDIPTNISVKQEIEDVSDLTNTFQLDVQIAGKFENEEHYPDMNYIKDGINSLDYKYKNFNSENTRHTLENSTSEDNNIKDTNNEKIVKNEFLSTKEYFQHNSECGESSKNFDTFVRKPSKNKTKIFTCELCTKSYRLKCDLKYHMNTHTGLKPFQCEVCSKYFSKKSYLRNHMYIHKNNRPNFSCEICNKTFNMKQVLNLHYLTHSEQRPFSCDLCEKRFKLKGHLVEHKRTHSGAKPFECDVCGRAFAQNSNLTIHKRVHTKELLYCDICNKQFTHGRSLNVHKQKCHNVT